MNLRVYEMASEAERKLVDRQAERGWQVAQAEALNSRRSRMTARGFTTMIGTALSRAGQFWKAGLVTPRPRTALARSEALGNEVCLSQNSWQQACCATGD
jgi:hypothetical protein